MPKYYCDICKTQKLLVTVRCHLVEGSPRLCKECLLSDYHVNTVHGGDTLATLMCNLSGSLEELVRRTAAES
jgi:hypothetical protein